MTKKNKQPRRNEKHKLYMQLLNSRRWWGDVRIEHLRKHPLCQMCERDGIITSAVDVHHLTPVQSVPINKMESVCYDPNNLISLCIECHRKIHRQIGSRHDLKAPSAPKDERQREFIRKWAGEETLREMDEREEFRRTRKLPRWLLTNEQKKQKDEKEQADWQQRMLSKFNNNGLQGTETTPSVDT